MHLQFVVKKDSLNQAKKILKAYTEAPLYEIEESTDVILGGFFKTLPDPLPDCLSSFTKLADEVDWQEQWESFSPSYKDNHFELDLSSYGASKTLHLIPGPGFGDLSHPTTRLCLEALKDRVQGKEVIDLGCGSGILSVAAYALGAKKVISLDIDEEALNHTRQNLEANGFRVDGVQPRSLIFDSDPLLVINMIFPEQKIALESLQDFPKKMEILSSGILKNQKKSYLDFAKSIGLSLKLEEALEGWLLFHGERVF